MLRKLGNTGLSISPIAFGCGPVSGLMTGEDSNEQRVKRRETVDAAVSIGVNWFDTAPGYGDGRSEINLGCALSELELQSTVQVATKVRFTPESLQDPRNAVIQSVKTSLDRLGVPRLALLQLHNSITSQRDSLPTSVSQDDVLKRHGILDAFEEVRREGLVQAIGLTGLGETRAVLNVIQSGRFQTIQLPINLLLMRWPIATESSIGELPLKEVLPVCQKHSMGIMAIRVFAGGALALASPSPYTHVSRFFTLDVYHRDQQRAAELLAEVPPDSGLPEFAVRQVLCLPEVSSAILGFGSPQEVQLMNKFSGQ